LRYEPQHFGGRAYVGVPSSPQPTDLYGVGVPARKDTGQPESCAAQPAIDGLHATKKRPQGWRCAPYMFRDANPGPSFYRNEMMLDST
jgi:hypothetical protein